MKPLALLACIGAALAALSSTALASPQGFQHRWAGLVFDAFLSHDGTKLWTVEDGGRIRHRNAAGTWSYQTVPPEVKDTLRRVHFLSNNATGWVVGNNGWVLSTLDGGTTWTANFQKASIASPTQPEELFDVHFLDDGLTGWLVGLHGVWFTTTGGLTESSWNQAVLFTASGSVLDPATIELYAVDVVPRGSGVLALVVAEPGYILRSVDPQATAFQVVWDVYTLCGTGVLTGCEATLCNSTPSKYEPWDVEISRNPSSEARLALAVGGIGGAQCGFVVRSSDDGLTWVKELHECLVSVPSPCDGNPLYENDPTTLTDTWRHKRFTSLYGVAIFDGDNGAVACGYNGQHLYRDPTRAPGAIARASAIGLWRRQPLSCSACTVRSRTAGRSPVVRQHSRVPAASCARRWETCRAGRTT